MLWYRYYTAVLQIFFFQKYIQTLNGGGTYNTARSELEPFGLVFRAIGKTENSHGRRRKRYAIGKQNGTGPSHTSAGDDLEVERKPTAENSSAQHLIAKCCRVSMKPIRELVSAIAKLTRTHDKHTTHVHQSTYTLAGRWTLSVGCTHRTPQDSRIPFVFQTALNA